MSSLPDYPEALQAALRGAPTIAETEPVRLAHAAGRVLAQPVIADRDQPPFNRAQMDGYALRFADLQHQREFAVADKIAAGASTRVDVPPGQCVAIATGAPLPSGLDTVIQHELTDRGDPVRISVSAELEMGTITQGHAVHPRGADAISGSCLLTPGVMLRPHHMGIAASTGSGSLVVRRRPRIAVITSGDEVISIEASPQSHQIRNSNGIMVMAILERIGATAIGHTHVADEQGATSAAVTAGLAQADMLISVGGISVGERDYLRGAFDACGVRPLVHGVRLQPGGPLFVGATESGKVVVGLPGNPVSALACTCLLVWPLVRKMLGLDPALPWRDAPLVEAVVPNSRRRAFRPAILQPGGRVSVPRWAGSGDLVHTAPTDGLVELPIQAERVPEGAVLRFLPWP